MLNFIPGGTIFFKKLQTGVLNHVASKRPKTCLNNFLAVSMGVLDCQK